MLPKQPKFEPDGPTESPALARRREPALPDPAGTAEEPDPDIPPFPGEAASPPSARVPAYAGMAVRRRAVLWPMAAGVLAVIGMGALAWSVYERMAAAPVGGEIPYVAAEAGPEKVRPVEEGGLEVPNQDIRVYNELSGAPPAPEPEVLLSPPETPVTPPQVAEAEPPSAPTENADIPVVPGPDLAPEVEMEPAAGEPKAEEPTESTESATETPAKPPQTAATAGAYRIQLAAVKDPDAARAAWKKMTRTHADVLAGLTLDLVKVERDGGALYRMQAGGFPDRGAAENACGKLKRKNQDCLVVAP